MKPTQPLLGQVGWTINKTRPRDLLPIGPVLSVDVFAWVEREQLGEREPRINHDSVTLNNRIDKINRRAEREQATPNVTRGEQRAGCLDVNNFPNVNVAVKREPITSELDRLVRCHMIRREVIGLDNPNTPGPLGLLENLLRIADHKTHPEGRRCRSDRPRDQCLALDLEEVLARQPL